MKLNIFAAIFMVSISLKQVFGSMTHEQGILLTDEGLVNPLDPTIETLEFDGCPGCHEQGKAHTCGK
ncbi:uncharacterized protein MELLADRAFT_124511 [Melampsora larici-populina 98AG31]|uniref:Secreted protein n=1 Tax=Melampsora larici-populina (strain 98AG31 / pathotype 3-4-7) TaxID=747676 RepID=F4RU06_MELLP|nr:uncharacterized protein MELLADRAFT_124511 [Melampsora larici-populina 98AG31]EGG04168.1 secreted protein [Melampsora larici-populina 98AG31]